MEMPEIHGAPVAVVLPNAAAGQMPVQVVAPGQAQGVAGLLHLQAAPGTVLSLVLRFMQCLTSVLGFIAMISAKDFTTVPAFISFVPITILRCGWSFSMFVLDLDAIFTDLNLANHWMTRFIIFGDAITAMSTFCATTASSGIVLYIYLDVATCATEHCTLFETAVTRMLICFGMPLPSVAVNWVMSWAAIFPRTSFQADVLLLYSNGSCSILSIIILFLYYINANSIQLFHHCGVDTTLGVYDTAGWSAVKHALGSNPSARHSYPVRSIHDRAAMAFWGLGTACAYAGVLHFFIKNGVFTKDVTARAIACCVLSLATGALLPSK